MNKSKLFMIKDDKGQRVMVGDVYEMYKIHLKLIRSFYTSHTANKGKLEEKYMRKFFDQLLL